MNKISQVNNSQVLSTITKFARTLRSTTVNNKNDESNNLMSFALKGFDFGQWDWNIETDEVNLSPDALLLLGYDKKEKFLKQNYLLDMIHHEDRYIFLDEIERLKKGIIDFINIEIRMKSAYDLWNWINMRGKIIEFKNDGSPLRFTGINYDINEQKLYDKEVHELQLKVFQAQENVANEQEPVAAMDRYSQFRLNGLKDLLEYN